MFDNLRKAITVRFPEEIINNVDIITTGCKIKNNGVKITRSDVIRRLVKIGTEVILKK